MSKHQLGLGPGRAPQLLERWHLHTGTVKLFISGPGPEAWLACSESYYSGQIGSEEEREIAHAALAILNEQHGQDKDAGPAEIRAALERSRHQLKSSPAACP